MTKSEIFIKAHKMTKEIVENFKVNYRIQFSISLKTIYGGLSMDIQEKIRKAFEETAKRWANAETEIEINNWKNKRIYINLSHHTVKCDMYIDLSKNELYTSSYYKNSTVKEAYKNAVEIVRNNIKEIINL